MKMLGVEVAIHHSDEIQIIQMDLVDESCQYTVTLEPEQALIVARWLIDSANHLIQKATPCVCTVDERVARPIGASAATGSRSDGEHPLDRAVRVGGFQSYAALAKVLGITGAAVSQWKFDGRRIPPAHARAISRLLDGKVTYRELCPEIFEDSDSK